MPTPRSPHHKRRLATFFQQVRDLPAPPRATAAAEESTVEVLREGSAPAALLGGITTEETLARIVLARQSVAREESFTPRTASLRASADQTLEIAQRALIKIQHGLEFDDLEAGVFEAVILPGLRPVIDVVGDSFAAPGFPFDFLGQSAYRTKIEAALRAVGRIELPLDPLRPFGGTGFFVGEGLLLTNRHVALLFAQGCGHPQSRTIHFRPGAAQVDLKKEALPPGAIEPAPLLLMVRDVLLIHPYWDAAILAVEPAANQILPPPIALLESRPAGPLGTRAVATIGYPQRNPDTNVEVQDQEFRRLYGRKRLLPGKLGMDRGGTREDLVDFSPQHWPTVRALTHDCSTLTGNSGSVVLDLETGAAIGLHFAGQYLLTNWAVPSWELARDPHLRALNLRFTPAPDSAVDDSSPAWLSAWRSVNATTTPVIARANTEAPALWYEQTDDAGIAAALRQDPEGTARRLYQVLPARDAEELIADLSRLRTGEAVGADEEAAQEESFLSDLLGRTADPSLPEIVLLHGILGGHLAQATGLGGRLWVNPLAFLAGDLAERLSLAPDGISERTPGQILRPDGLIRMTYATAARTLRKAGYVVHEFSYDWRKPIDRLGDSLHRFIEERAFQSPGKRFALVAHSMGGVVASLYAAQHKEWTERIHAAVLLGSPILGSYAPMQAVLGTSDTTRKLAMFSRNDVGIDFQKMACTFPGLLNLLPDPTVFPDAARLFKSAGWPDPNLCPADDLLAHSRTMKRKAAQSPLRERTYLIVSQRHPTVGSVFGVSNGRGDGTVPLKSAALAGDTLVRGRFVAQNLHGKLPQEPAVLRAIDQLLRGDPCTALPPLDPAALASDALPENEAVAAQEEAARSAPIDTAAIRERFQTGAFSQEDWLWLTETW